MKDRRTVLVLAVVVLVAACSQLASPSPSPAIITTAPPASDPSVTPQSTLLPATFPDRSPLPSGGVSLPPLVQPGNSPIGS